MKSKRGLLLWILILTFDLRWIIGCLFLEIKPRLLLLFIRWIFTFLDVFTPFFSWVLVFITQFINIISILWNSKFWISTKTVNMIVFGLNKKSLIKTKCTLNNTFQWFNKYWQGNLQPFLSIHTYCIWSNLMKY